MTFFLISLIIGIIGALIGHNGVQRTGNYENVWGAYMIWSVPVMLLIGVLFGFLL